MNKEIRDVNQQVYNRIKSKILQLEFKLGERLNIKDLSEEFHVSPTPLREGIKKLIEGGLIKNIPRRGYYVYSPTVKDIHEIYELRRMFECFALRSIKDNITDFRPFEKVKKRIEYIQKQNDKEKRRRFIETESIHTVIVYSVDNQRIKNIYRDLHNFTLIFQHMVQLDTINRSITDHFSLVNCIMNKNIDEAQIILSRHTEEAIAILCSLLKREL